nr:hypothetical protein [uncultured Lichenicoccus sp.]
MAHVGWHPLAARLQRAKITMVKRCLEIGRPDLLTAQTAHEAKQTGRDVHVEGQERRASRDIDPLPAGSATSWGAIWVASQEPV